jgi:large-conductance mechanosensitive channel
VVNINRVIGFLVLAFIIFFIITDPRSAAGVVQSIAYTLREAAESVTLFFREVV